MNDELQSIEANNVVGVLLAGGASRRFGGGDKCLRLLGQKTLLQRVADRANPQVGRLILNASGDADRFKDYDLEVVSDCIEGSFGPLVGILSGMEWARAHEPKAQWVASFATDAPFIPQDLIDQLLNAARQRQAKIVVARSNHRPQPVFPLWQVDLADDLRKAIVEEGMRKVMAWVERYDFVFVDFESDLTDPFFNINTEEDLTEAETFAQKDTDA